jgi:hypothetical protein
MLLHYISTRLKELIIASFILTTAFSLSSANAAVEFITADSQLVGATGITLPDGVYDVRFVEGTFGSVFSSTIPAFHSTEPSARAFSGALINQVFPLYLGATYSSPLNEFAYNPSLTFGCFRDDNCAMLVPYAANETVVAVFEPTSNSSGINRFTQVTLPNSYSRGFDSSISLYSAGEGRVWAKFSKASVSPVPETSTLAMFVAGLGLLALRRRQT